MDRQACIMHQYNTCFNTRNNCLALQCKKTSRHARAHYCGRRTAESSNSLLEDVIIKLPGRRWDILATNTRKAAGGWPRSVPLYLNISSQDNTKQAEDGPPVVCRSAWLPCYACGVCHLQRNHRVRDSPHVQALTPRKNDVQAKLLVVCWHPGAAYRQPRNV